MELQSQPNCQDNPFVCMQRQVHHLNCCLKLVAHGVVHLGACCCCIRTSAPQLCYLLSSHLQITLKVYTSTHLQMSSNLHLDILATWCSVPFTPSQGVLSPTPSNMATLWYQHQHTYIESPSYHQHYPHTSMYPVQMSPRAWPQVSNHILPVLLAPARLQTAFACPH